MIHMPVFFLEVLLICSPGPYLCSPLDICASSQKSENSYHVLPESQNIKFIPYHKPHVNFGILNAYEKVP